MLLDLRFIQAEKSQLQAEVRQRGTLAKQHRFRSQRYIRNQINNLRKSLWSFLGLILMVSDIENGIKRRHNRINADKLRIRW